MKTKSELARNVQNFVNMIENQHKTTPQMIRTNNGPDLSSFYNAKCIQHQK